MQFDEPKLPINPPRYFGEQIGRIRVAAVRGLTDCIARGLAKGGQSARNGEDMLVAVGEAKGIGNEEGVFGGHLHGSLGGACQARRLVPR